ncbi:MAG: PqqD family protein [Candidatus Omnitrophica bacterium]|nr:PqqD family protein [Candidatus Omnitrophota bacterium]
MKADQLKGKCMTINEEIISWREIDKEVVFLNKQEKSFYELNKTAEIIWRQLAKGGKLTQVISQVQKKYKKVGKQDIERDVIAFIADGIKKKIFIVNK